jgi:3-hydroxyacyl-[acyl-carrier-protein] dehydratase
MKFRMVDRILAWQPRRRIGGTKTVSFEEYNLRAALGAPAALPESLLLESFFQLGNWLIVLSSDFTQMGLIVRTEEVRFTRPLLPGECLEMELTVRRWRDDGVLFDGVGRAGGREVAVGVGCLAALAPLADFSDPEDLRVLFSEIHRPLEEKHA